MSSRGKYKPSQESDRYVRKFHATSIFRANGTMNVGKFRGVHYSKLPEWYVRWCRANMDNWDEDFAAIDPIMDGKPLVKVKPVKKLPILDRLNAVSERVRASESVEPPVVHDVLDPDTASDPDTAPW